MAAKEPGRLAFETFAATMRSRLHLKWDYELFSREEKEAWAEVERAVREDALRPPEPSGPECPYCPGSALVEGPVCPVEWWECPFPPEPHAHWHCPSCGQRYVHPAPEARTSKR